MAKTASADPKSDIKNWLNESGRVLAAASENTEVLSQIADALLKAYKNGGKLVLFGNGGSAADAQHLAAEMVGGLNDHSRPSYPALALTTDTSALTAIANDYDYDSVFSRQVESMVQPGDVVMALSTSGNSKNVVRGAEAAKKRGALVVGFTGESGGRLAEIADVAFRAPSQATSHIQEVHIAAGHAICAKVEADLSGAR